MSTTNELRVFISSTFRDLQEEREHLVKKIFPEIRSLCRERGVTFTEIDLRWGLTEEQAALGTVIRTCLEEVDKCRPYFIGMLGDRYGWVPELHELLMDPDLLANYPWIEDVAIDGASVTEMEFIHGVFDAPQVDGEYAFFYHRRSDLSEADDPERLSALIARARATGRPFREFVGIDELGRQVHDDLVAMIDRYWPESEAPSALELERRSHAAFAASRTRAYIPNPEYLKSFSGWVSDGALPLVVSGASGLGKSSLVAYLVDSYRRKHPTAFVIEHYVGASQSSGTALALMRHVVEAIRERFGIGEELPSRPEELEKSFANWLFRAESHAAQAGIPLLIVLDAVNQLDASGQRLSWLPKTIPSGVKLLVSTTPGEAGGRLEERGWESLEVRPLEDERVRQSIVVRYLGEFHKGIAPDQLRQVVSDAKASSPLYLRVVAEELRLHGDHETVAAMIARYSQAETILQVFDLVLERLEKDYGEVQVRTVLEMIWTSRAGLSETELLELTGVGRLDLSRLLFALDYHLSRRDGLLGFFHDYLRRAVEKRYLTEEQQKRKLHERIAEHFEREAVTLRATREVLHALESLGDRDRLREVLTEIKRFELLWPGSDRYEVLRHWSGSDHEAMVTAYRSGMEAWVRHESPQAERRVVVLGFLAHMYETVANRREAEQVQQERLTLLRELNDRAGESRILASLGNLAWRLGRMDEAELLVRNGVEVARESEDRQSIAYAVGSRGNLHWIRGEHDAALVCYREQEEILQELGDRGGIASAVGNRGLVYAGCGEHDAALACYREQEEVMRELGDRRSVALAISNRGSVYWSLGEYDAALACTREQEEIGRELGDRVSIGRAVGHRGLIHATRGEHDVALRCYREQEEIGRELGDRRMIAAAVANRGLVHAHYGEHDLALQCYEEHEKIGRELADRQGVATALGNSGLVYSDRGEYDAAFRCFREQEEIARELGDRESMARAVGNRGSVHRNRDEYEQALECYRQATLEHRAIGYRFGLSHWLDGIARVLVELAVPGGSPLADAQPRRSQVIMPGYLSTYLPDINDATWRPLSLRAARECAEECLAIARELSTPGMIFSSRMLLARIDAAEGSAEAASQCLAALLEAAGDDEERVQLHFWLWKFDGSPRNNEHQTEALRLYRQLIEKTPKHEYRRRIDELTAASTTRETGNAAAE